MIARVGRKPPTYALPRLRGGSKMVKYRLIIDSNPKKHCPVPFRAATPVLASFSQGQRFDFRGFTAAVHLGCAWVVNDLDGTP